MAWIGRPGTALHVTARCVPERHGRYGTDGAERTGKEWIGRHGYAGKAKEWWGSMWQDRQGVGWCRAECSGAEGTRQARCGAERRGTMGSGTERQAMRGAGRTGRDARGEDWRGQAGEAKHVAAWQGRAGHGQAGLRRDKRQMRNTRAEGGRRDPLVIEVFNSIASSGEKLTPQAVVDAARDPHSPIHAYFEWDDSVAGEKYRRIQAYQLLAAQRAFLVASAGVDEEIYVDAETKGVSLRQFLPALTGDNAYLQREQAKADPLNRSRLVEAFRAELRAWCRRTIDFDELAAERTAILSSLDRGAEELPIAPPPTS